MKFITLSEITSLCPALGRKYAQLVAGMCPAILQKPQGKTMPVTYFGSPPYIISNKKKQLVGGTDLEILNIYAKKFGFTPKVRKEIFFDIINVNGTKRGLVGSVRFEIWSNRIISLKSIYYNTLTTGSLEGQ